MWLRTHPNGDTAAFAKLTGIGSVWLAQKVESICCYRCLRSKNITPDFGETAARGGLLFALMLQGMSLKVAHRRRELISAFWSLWEEKRTSRSRQSKSEFDRAPFDRHLLGSLPTLIFHLAAVEAHGAFMVAGAQFRQKNGCTSLCCHGLYRKWGRERCWRVS
jgi:hypothetical protein